MFWWMTAAAFANGGNKTCPMQGHTLQIRWTEAGSVTVSEHGSSLVSASIGRRKGPTTATCLPTGVKFLTDTQEVPGRFTLETVRMDLKSVLSTLREPEAAPSPPTPKPRRRARPKPKPKMPAPGVIEARDCVQNKAWEAYAEGWTVRSISTEVLKAGARRNLALQFIAKADYRLLICGASTVQELDGQLVSEAGYLRASDGGSRQLELEYRSRKNLTHHLLVENLGTEDGAVAIAVLTH